MLSRAVPIAWELAAPDEALVRGLATALRLRPLTARVLVVRGLHAPAEVTRFLNPRLADLRPPDGIADLGRALERLVLALSRGERLGVFGDYDVDGVTSAAVLTLGFRALGGEVVPRVAHRQKGYGLGVGEVEAFVADGCRVLVTADCGTSDLPALERAVELGLDVVVIDHHQVPEGTSKAYALINPHRSDDGFPFKGLASCGLAFYLVAALRTRLGGERAARFDPRELLDLVALGTVADLVPLKDENRILVAAGLRGLAGRRRPALRALCELAKVNEGAATAEDIAFRLAPRLNAAGRLGAAQLALDLLLADKESEVARLAQELDDCNRERQRIQELVWEEALRQAEEQAQARVLVVGAPGWHPGVVGIVAARLVDRFLRPAFVVGFQDGLGRGSARTTGGVNVYRILHACRDHLLRFGGHAAAAGLTLAEEAFLAFREAACAAAALHPPESDRHCLRADAVVDLAALDMAQAEELQKLGPFGAANPEPLFVVRGVTAAETRVVGENHLQLTLVDAVGSAEAIAFNLATRDPGRGSRVDVLAAADIDSYRGVRRARLRVRHLFGADEARDAETRDPARA